MLAVFAKKKKKIKTHECNLIHPKECIIKFDDLPKPEVIWRVDWTVLRNLNISVFCG